MERCKCLPLNSKFVWKSVLVKTKPFNRQLFQLINRSKCCPLAQTHAVSPGRHWSVALSMMFCLNSPKNSYFKLLQGSVATLFRWSWKILPYFVANLSKTLHIYFYQNRSSIVEVMTKNFGAFMPHSVLPNVLCLLANNNLYQARLLRSTS